MNFVSPIPSFVRLANFGIIDASGADAGHFLHRMSTNNIDILQVGESCLTAFTNQKARLIALSYVVKKDKDSFQLIIPYDNAQVLLDWLDQYLFAEDVKFSDVSQEYQPIWLLGHVEVGIPGPKFQLQSGVTNSSILVCTKNDAERECKLLISDGAKELSHLEFEAIRIAGIVPFSTGEINLNHHPIQLGLNEAIHWAKGCYIGQEVISRLEAKDRAEQTLVGLNTSESEFHKLKKEESIRSDGQIVGTFTSVAPIYLPSEANALTVLKRINTTKTLVTDLSNVHLDRLKQRD